MSDNDAIKVTLADMGCCWRCTLRFLGEKDTSVYQCTEKQIKANVAQEQPNGLEANEDCPTKIVKNNACTVCLGLLQDQYGFPGLQQLCEDIVVAGHDSETFSCTISLPISQPLREQSVWGLLQDKYPKTYANVVRSEFVTSLKEAWKGVYSSVIAKRIGKTLTGHTSDYQINIHIGYQDDDKDLQCLLTMCPAMFAQRSQKKRVYSGKIFTRNAIEMAITQTSFEHFSKHFSSPPPVPDVAFYYEKPQCYHNSIFLAGRYNKYSRSLSQTPWMIDGEKKMETSVQELICDPVIVPYFKADGLKFSSSGREDVDVRTLGQGRPFVVELLNPRKVCVTSSDVKRLEGLVNESTRDVAVRHLQVVTKEDISNLKEGEEEKTKCYTALCVTLNSEPLKPEQYELMNRLSELKLFQKTPLRVLHRRPLATRERTVHNVKSWPMESRPNHFKVQLRTQAGTYIKEFIHGDFGRTQPNLNGLLGTEVDIIALDVDEVELDWPRPT